MQPIKAVVSILVIPSPSYHCERHMWIVPWRGGGNLPIIIGLYSKGAVAEVEAASTRLDTSYNHPTCTEHIHYGKLLSSHVVVN